MLKACGEQSVMLTGTVEMQLLCVGNWDTLLLVSQWKNKSVPSGGCAQCVLSYCYVIMFDSYWLLHSMQVGNSSYLELRKLVGV